MIENLRGLVWNLLPGPLQAVVRLLAVLWGPVAFAGGFAWDAVTLDRIDRWSDNAILGAYLVALGGALILDERAARKQLPALLVRWRWIWRFGVQFLFGGLLSAYVVYYLQSATTWRTLLFLAVLAGLLLANEFLQRVLSSAILRELLYLLCAFSFLLFFIPVATGVLDRAVWFLAAAGAVGLTAAVRLLSDWRPRQTWDAVRTLADQVREALPGEEPATVAAEEPDIEPVFEQDLELPETPPEPPPPAWLLRVPRSLRPRVRRIAWQVGPALRYAGHGLAWSGVMLLLLVADALNMIPPVPISVLDTRVAHDVTHTAKGAVLTYEATPWWGPWSRDDSTFRLRESDRVCFFAPVYTPLGTSPRLYHRWEFWDAEAGEWRWTGDRGTWVQATGGKDQGSVHHTCKRNGLRPGPWRVTVETEDGRVVGWHGFELVQGPETEPDLVTRTWP